MNDIKVNPTQKGTKVFMMLITKTCPGLYQNMLNYYKALSSKNQWSLFFFDDLVISPTSKSAELTLSIDLVLKFLPRQ